MGIKKAVNTNIAKDLIKENKIENYPPKLQKLYDYIQNNYSFDSMKALCSETGDNYKSICTMIDREKRKGNNFYDLIYDNLNVRNNRLLYLIDNKVLDKALESNMRAAELFYKRTGSIQSGSGGDRVQVNNQVNLTFMSPLPNKDDIDV